MIFCSINATYAQICGRLKGRQCKMLTFTREIARTTTSFFSWSGQKVATGGVAQSRAFTLTFLSLSPMLSQQEVGKGAS